ncbi:MAG: SH3 domain-containing protein [Chloroflexi bacterium]|nr:SH3 domain-containing protein [Chloroflexota bacterium]
MFKRMLWVVILLLALPAAAQGETWTAWLFDGATGLMTRVSETGEQEAFVLPLSPGFDRYPRRVAAGHGGAPFAYLVYNSDTFQGQLIVSRRDALQAAFSLPLTLGDTFEFNAGENVFNDDNTALAFGYSLDGGGWAIVVMDTRTGGIAHTLRADDPLVGVLGIPGGYGLTPVVRRFLGRDVIFTLVQSGTEGAAEYDSYAWNLDTGALIAHPGYPALQADTLPSTGETVMALYDARLPNQSDSFIFFQANALHVYEPVSGARFPFYNAPAESLFGARFIQNGELVLVNAGSADGLSSQWHVIRRDGNLAGTLPSTTALQDVAGLPDGFLYTTDAFNPGATTLVYVNTRGGLNAGAPVWTSAPGAQPVIVWAGGAAAATALLPWAQLAEPIYAPGVAAAAFADAPAPAPISPGQIAAATPVIGGFLAVGGLATVNTTEGDNLNLRLGPGTNFEIIGKLPSGARVTLLEGPRFAEGLTWWKIRAASGIEGWAVESVNDNGTRLQTLLPG